MPTKQVMLLQLWDELGVPHEEKRQEWGTCITIIGFDVDADSLQVTMPTAARTQLVQALRKFTVVGQRQSLHDFQHIAGWVNWL